MNSRRIVMGLAVVIAIAVLHVTAETAEARHRRFGGSNGGSFGGSYGGSFSSWGGSHGGGYGGSHGGFFSRLGRRGHGSSGGSYVADCGCGCEGESSDCGCGGGCDGGCGCGESVDHGDAPVEEHVAPAAPEEAAAPTEEKKQ